MNSKRASMCHLAVISAVWLLSGPAPAAERQAPPLAVAPFDAAEAKRHQQAWAEYLGVPLEITNSIGMKLVLIPPGEYLMGSRKSEDGAKAERPQHPVRITRPFYLGKHPVTQTQWESLMGTNPSFYCSLRGGSRQVSGRSTADFPVESVNWNDVQKFVRKLNQQPSEPGGVYRLPSEAEWEYACRAGTNTRYFFGNDERQLGDYAVYVSNSGATWRPPRNSRPQSYDAWGFPQDNRSDIEKRVEDHFNEWRDRRMAEMGGVWIDPPSQPDEGRYIGGSTQPVGMKRPNAWDLHDMHGNVWEWCSDWFDADYYARSPVEDPPGPDTGSHRVIRGGSWQHQTAALRSALRQKYSPGSGADNIGFRVAKSVATSVEFPAAFDRPAASAEPALDAFSGLPLAVAPFDAATARRHQESWSAHLARPVELTKTIGDGAQLNLVLIPPGEFVMGTPTTEQHYREQEGPQHRVRITKPFYLGMYPITQSQWESVMGSNPSAFSSQGTDRRVVQGMSTADFPVENINWKDTQRFLKRLNRQLPETDWAYRLPTEAEWEYACRAGTNTRYYYGDDTLLDRYGNRAQQLGEYAWYRGNLRSRTHAVGQKKPNAWGLHDMLGNISEFCADWYDRDYYANSPLEDPTGPTSGWGHVLRGGKWNSTAWECRPAYRDNSQDSEHRNYYQGLRVVFGPAERVGQ